MTNNSQHIQFASAATYSLEALADIFTRSFEGYFYPGVTTAQLLAERIRREQIDLFASLVLLVDNEPAGTALLAARGSRVWCGGFGITVPFRGRGLAYALADAMVRRARDAGAATFSLEVLTRNEKAFKAYRAAGLAVVRDLHIFEWRGEPITGTQQSAVIPAEPRALLADFDQLHPARAAWQRDLPALLVKNGMQGIALLRDGTPAAYLLLSERQPGTVRIEDLAALRVEDATLLLRTLQGRASTITSVNEPSDSPVLQAFTQAGFTESDRQHEMECAL